MDQQAQDFLKKVADHPMRSRLEPYRDLIGELRRRRYPYRKIASILQDQFAIRTSKSALHDFIKVRVRNARQRPPELTLPPSPPQDARFWPDPEESAILGARSAVQHEMPQPHIPTAIHGKRNPTRPQSRFSFDPTVGLTLSDEDLNLKPKKD
jgi:hypothetical protein